jgi:hypothetical protein
MEKLIKNPTFLMIGAGVLAFAVANMIMNRKAKGKTQDEFSNFVGCVCNNGMGGGGCASSCETCCKKAGGVNQRATKSAYGFAGEESSDFVGGCVCNNGQSGSCGTNCASCCARSGGADRGATRKMYGFAG